MDVLEAVREAIQHLEHPVPGELITVAVSGGADSTCLLDCLHQLDLPLVVAHYDHGLRPGSWGDARHVLRLAARMQLPAFAARAGPGVLRARGGSLENAARQARYRFLGETARAAGSRLIAVGHTLDDQAETVLMHLVRGAGAAGLRGMRSETDLRSITGAAQDTGLRVIRPLLEVPRSATMEWCRSHGRRVRDDPTNADATLLRNRIRRHLLPLLEGYNPAIRQALGRTADLLAAEAEAIEGLAQAAAPAMVATLADGRPALDPDDFGRLPIGLQRFVVRQLLLGLIGGGEVGFESVERARLAMEGTARVSLVGGLEVVTDDGLRVFCKAGESENVPAAYPQYSGDAPQVLEPSGHSPLAGGWRVEARLEPMTGAAPREVGSPQREIMLDADASGAEFLLDIVRPGDRMTPFGAPGSKKVSDLLQQAKVPVPARAGWPVLRQAGSIVWLVGLRRSEGARIGPRTRRVVRLRLLGPGEG